MRLLLILTLLFSSVATFAADKITEIFTLDHQMSEMCEKRIKENLRFEKGIDKIDVSLKNNTISITYNPEKTDTDKIIGGFKKIGFTAFPVEDKTSEGECRKEKGCPGCPNGGASCHKEASPANCH